MDTLAHKEGVEGVNYFILGTTDVFDYGKGYADLEYKLDTPEEVSETQFQFIENYITTCRNALINKDLNLFTSLVDLDSFIDYFLLAEIFRNTDLAGRSVYLYLPDITSKLIYGPSWDFDYTCSRPYQLGPNQDYTLENATDRFSHFDFWEKFLEIEGTHNLIASRYTNYIRPIVNFELEEEQRYYNFYEEYIKNNANNWYPEIEDIDALLENNFNWTFSYFKLRMKFYDSIYLA
ncbi:MAG: CotH kinase family protein [Bacilli bacterium]|nr:CotH kinase family protein [Bacilli bacterium]